MNAWETAGVVGACLVAACLVAWVVVTIRADNMMQAHLRGECTPAKCRICRSRRPGVAGHGWHLD